MASQPSQFEHHRGDDHDDEEEEGVLDREGSNIDDDNDDDGLVIVEQDHDDDQDEEGTADLVSVTKLVHSATSNHSFQNYFDNNEDENDEDRELSGNKECKKSAYSAAPHKIPCPYCSRKFPWTSSLNRHILTHTGQKPYKCSECPLWFTTKSNCDRHVIRKHGEANESINNNNHQTITSRGQSDRPSKSQVFSNSSPFSAKTNMKSHLFTRNPEGHLDHPGAEGGSSADDEDEGMDFEDEIAENNCEVDEGVLKGRARFRCHICLHPVQVFCNRKTALNHLKIKHPQDYEVLELQGNIDLCENLPDEEESLPSYFKPISCLFCSNPCNNSEELRGHIEESHNKRVSASSSPIAQNLTKPVGPAQDKNDFQLKKKRPSLMDKISQLSANASSIQSSLFKQKEPEQIMVE
jgi:hypothetical protein